MIKELKEEYQKWCESKSTPGYMYGSHASSVWDFLEMKERQRPRSIPCDSIKDVKENAVMIMTLMGDPNLVSKEDLMEIDEAATEIYDFCNRQVN